MCSSIGYQKNDRSFASLPVSSPAGSSVDEVRVYYSFRCRPYALTQICVSRAWYMHGRIYVWRHWHDNSCHCVATKVQASAFFRCAHLLPLLFHLLVTLASGGWLLVIANSSGSAGRQGPFRISASRLWGGEPVIAMIPRSRGGAVTAYSIQ